MTTTTIMKKNAVTTTVKTIMATKSMVTWISITETYTKMMMMMMMMMMIKRRKNAVAVTLVMATVAATSGRGTKKE